MSQRHKEFWVGFLVILSLMLVLVFGWLVGAFGSFSSERHFYVLYGFAGGVELGSPVRVSGVKVGKVERIEFLPGPQANDTATVRVTVGVNAKAAPLVREDSRFFINIAGIIGERYLEISPGTASAPELQAEATIRGVDPPRIDQLVSQGYGVFGRVQDFLEQNEKTMTEFLGNMNSVMKDANQVLKKTDRQKLISILNNLNELTTNLNDFSKAMKSPKAGKFVDELSDMVDRAHEIDKETLKQFLQKDGIRAHIF